MQGKVVLITGAKGGLGNFVTRTFLDAGTNVVGVSRSISQADFPHPRFVAAASELNSVESAQVVIDCVVERFGRLDALVHLVGGFAGGTTVAETDAQTFARMFDTNVSSAFFAIRAAIPHLRKTAGRIVAIGSRAVEQSSPGAAVYAASKAALVSLIKNVAAENADAGVTANIILPGTMDTPANRSAMPAADFNKWVPPQAVADSIYFLSSDAAAQTTGAVIPIYGRDA